MSQKTEPNISISLTCKRAAEALGFYTKVFGVVELFRVTTPNGGVGHAEFLLGNTRMSMSDEFAEWQAYAMPEGGRASCLFAFNVDNADEVFARAVAAGATPLSPPQDQFWGKRTSIVCDPFGCRWNLRRHIEDVSPEELMKLAQAHMSGAPKLAQIRQNNPHSTTNSRRVDRARERDTARTASSTSADVQVFEVEDPHEIHLGDIRHSAPKKWKQ